MGTGTFVPIKRFWLSSEKCPFESSLQVAHQTIHEIEGKYKYALDLLKRYAKKVYIFLPCLAKIAISSSRNQNPPLTEPFGIVKIKGSLHRLNLRVGSRDLMGLDTLVKRVGRICAGAFGNCFYDGRWDVISLERARE